MPSMAATTHKGKLTIAFDMIYNTQKKTHNCLTVSSATHKGKLTVAFDVIHKSQKKDHKFTFKVIHNPQKKAHKILPSKSSTTPKRKLTKFCLQSHPQHPKESSQNFAFNVIPNSQREPFSIVSKTSSHPAIAHTTAKKPTLLLL
jgi:hypothetical protein